jgi:hypothetical protein
MSNYKALLSRKAELDRLIEETRKAEVSGAVAEARALIAEFGLTSEDVFGGARPGRRLRPRVRRLRLNTAIPQRALLGQAGAVLLCGSLTRTAQRLLFETSLENRLRSHLHHHSK